MTWIIVGLGNPGEEYKDTRHNTGRSVLKAFQKKENFSDWREDKKSSALLSDGKIIKEKTILVLPETFMNNSGKTAGQIKDLRFKTQGKGKEKRTEIENLIVVHDDLDLSLGRLKISFNKSSGGHRGVESIIRVLKTEAFIRVRVGISPEKPNGDPKKPQGEKAVSEFILGKFKPAEAVTFKKVSAKASEALRMIVADGRESAMGKFNSL